MRIYRLAWWSLALPVVLVGVVGAIATSSVLTVVIVFGTMALSLGTLSATLQSLDGEGQASTPISRSAVICHGSVAGAAVVAMYGMATVAGIAVVPLAVLIAGTCPLTVTKWRAALSSKPEAGVEEGRSARADECSVCPTRTVGPMTDLELCLAWRRSFVELQRTDSAEAMGMIAAFRRQVLDELERRNPSGFDQWMASGARAPSDPARYLLDPPERRLQ